MLTQVSSGTFTRALTDGSWGSFPFGCLNLRRPATTPTSGAAKVAVLGVYPSALHVEWTAPDASTHIAALAVDVEPEVFWKGDGDDPDELLERWKATARVNVSHGTFAWAAFNGSSGAVVAEAVLEPLGVSYDECFFTDCVPFFFVKNGKGEQGTAITSKWGPVAERLTWKGGNLPTRPSPTVLVDLAASAERALAAEIASSQAPVLVTFGQEAADAFARVATVTKEPPGLPLHHDNEQYGAEGKAVVGDLRVTWIPLAHPGTTRRGRWEATHKRWSRTRS